MILIQPHAEGATLAVRAQPSAKKNAVLGELKIAVTAPPLDGRANEAILDVLANWLGAKRSQVELLRGASNRNKVVLVRGFTAEELSKSIRSGEG
jgi:uncharacterized protein (TIGR00251 family)